ncbi:MAG: hypothetical protein ACREJC_01335, partial [Tepidisphaeraceae bacterium]
MTRSRQILVVVLVASALCADEAGVAAPVHRAEATSVASRIVTRISVSFRRVVTAIRICQPLREGTS